MPATAAGLVRKARSSLTAHQDPPAGNGRHRRTHRLRIPLALTAAVAVTATTLSLLASADDRAAAAAPGDRLRSAFTAAAGEFHVPQSVLLALSYQQSRWEQHDGQPSTTGNYNVMGLTEVDPAAVAKALAQGPGPETDGRGDGTAPAAEPAPVPVVDSPALHTLEGAAKLIKRPSAQLKSDPAQSIRGAAALLVKYQKDAGRPVSGDPAAWYESVARFSEATDDASGHAFADRVYNTIRLGAARTTSDGERVELPADTGVAQGSASTEGAPRSSADGQGSLPALPVAAAAPTKGKDRAVRGKDAPKAADGTAAAGTADGRTGTAAASRGTARPALAPLSSNPEPHPVECPTALNCDFQEAAYDLTNAADPTSYGNYTIANRPDDGDRIEYIVIHDTEGGYAGSIQTFQNPKSQASAHYIVRASDGHVTQLVNNKNIAWQAGNKTVNMHSIGVEHEGYAFPTGTQPWYSEQLYQSSATLVRYLAAKYGVPLDREHIIGHDDVPGPTQATISGMHWDPGTFWDWNHYMDLLGAPVRANAGGVLLPGGKVTIAPAFDATNTPPVDGIPARPENFVYLYTGPNSGTLINGGTTQAADVRAKAVAGTSFVVAEQQGDWTAVWYGGKKAWFANPGFTAGVADDRPGQVVLAAKPGAASIPVYGRTYPELSAYPAEISTANLEPVAYTASVPAGQGYLAGSPVALDSDFYYAQNINGDAPKDRTRVVGTDTYYPIRFDHRLAYLKSSDVQVVANSAPAPSGYTPAGPYRLLDTRNGTGAAKAKVGASRSITLQVAGAGLGNGTTVPNDITAVVLNVTATNPTSPSFVAVYPDGQPRSSASNLNFTPGQTVPNLVIVPVVNGKVDLYNNDGTVDLIADITGYYSPSGASKLSTAGPYRLLDTRAGLGAPQAKVGPTRSITLQVAGAGLGNGATVPNDITAVVLNVTATNPTSPSFVAVYPDGTQRTSASNLNFTPGQTVPNLVIVPVVNGKVDLYNNDGTVDLIADISGYYTRGGGASFVSAGPARLMDTRTGLGAPQAKVGAGRTVTLRVAGPAGVPADAKAVVLNVTATNPTGPSFVAVYPNGTQRTSASNLNFTPGQTVPNLVVVPVVNGKVDLYNNDGTVDLIADITGYYR
ncbi:N-acetylmuramoyl-L-alanine amidase [Kitasatospora cineracea]|uniref:N-acetylmuramoyl-L-alanine amidase n=1 Tax=Kitasatospora cineracea TaxID=88074 RepID=UPI0033DE10E0